MIRTGETLADIAFDAEVIHWRGPAPFYFLAVPEDHVGEIRYAAQIASYGWGCVPVAATANGVDFRTSLFPKDGGYLLPLKVVVRKESGLDLGVIARVRIRITS